jgi:oxygen-dependent protoporphyrinogen oxidase
MERARYTKMVNASVALTRPPTERSMYLQVPRSVHPGLIGIEFEHNKAPGRAPAGKGLVALFSGASWADELIDEDDDLVAKRLLDAADQVVPGLSTGVEFATVFRWDPMVLVSRPGYWRELQQFHQLRRADDRLVQLAGDWFCCSNLNSAAAAGQRAARDLTAVLGGRAERTEGRISDGST